MHENDNVAIVVNDGGLHAGSDFLRPTPHRIRARKDIKSLLEDIIAGAAIKRYNVIIGYASESITAGRWIQESLVHLPSTHARQSPSPTKPHPTTRRSKAIPLKAIAMGW